MGSLISETWLDVKGYEGLYKVSNFGRIKSIDRIVKNKNGKYRKFPSVMLRYSKKYCGRKNFYYQVTLRYEHGVQVHRVVAEAFIPNPENKPTVNHIDGDKTNNKVSNLEWATYSENNKHAHELGLTYSHMKFKGGDKGPGAKLTNEQAIQLRRKFKEGYSRTDLMKEYKIHRSTVCRIINKETFKEI